MGKTEKRKRKDIKNKKLPTAICEGCNETFKCQDMVFGPDPYESEINHDHTKKWLCKECNRKSLMET